MSDALYVELSLEKYFFNITIKNNHLNIDGSNYVYLHAYIVQRHCAIMAP